MLRFIFTYLFIYLGFLGLGQRISLVRVAPEFFYRIQKNKEKGIYQGEDVCS